MALPILLTVGALGAGWVALGAARAKSPDAPAGNLSGPRGADGAKAGATKHNLMITGVRATMPGTQQNVDQTAAGVPGGAVVSTGNPTSTGLVLAGGLAPGSGGNPVPGSGADPSTSTGTSSGGDDPSTSPQTGTVPAPTSTPTTGAGSAAAPAAVDAAPDANDLIAMTYGPAGGTSSTQSSRTLGAMGPGLGLVW